MFNTILFILLGVYNFYTVNNLNLLTTVIYHTVLIQQYLTWYTIGFLCLMIQCTSTM